MESRDRVEDDMTKASEKYNRGACEDVEETNFLALPAELRNRIYDFAAQSDLETFVETMGKPALLETSAQLRREYSDVFFGKSALQIDTYDGVQHAWKQVGSKQAKRVIFERCVFTDLLDFWSFASARRYCQRIYSDWQGNLQTGIMTIKTRGGIKRWQWSMALPD